MTNHYTYRFQLKVKPNSKGELVLKFLKAKDSEVSEKERLLQALSAFWLPQALIDAGNYSEKEIALYGLTAIQHLREQITHQSLVLSLECPSYSHFFIPNLLNQTVVPTGDGNGNANNSTQSQPQVQKETAVKAYTQVDGLEEGTPDLDPDANDGDEEDFTSIEEELVFSTDTTNQIDKIFEL